MIVVSKMDTENIDFPKLLASIQEMWGKACVPLNVPIGSGHDFKGVVSTLKPPADTKGALADVNVLNQALIETIVEIDEEVLARYFEGTPPTDEETARLIVQSRRPGKFDSDRLRGGQGRQGLKELLDALAMCALVAGQDCPQSGERGRGGS